MSDDLAPATLAVLRKMMDLEKKVPPEELWLVGVCQVFAEALAEIEHMLTLEQRAVFYGVGANLIREANKETEAGLMAMFAIGRAQKR